MRNTRSQAEFGGLSTGIDAELRRVADLNNLHAICPVLLKHHRFWEDDRDLEIITRRVLADGYVGWRA